MITIYSVLLGLTVLAAQLLQGQAYDFSSAKLCTTKYGSKSVSVKSTTYSLTVPVTVTRKVTITPTSSITPPPQTTTTTSTVTTTSVVVTTPTSTFTETDTETDTATTTTVITTGTTTTVTATSSTDAITVSTPAGFTPISSEPGYVPKKRSSELAIRGRHVEERTNSNTPICPPVGKPGLFSQYPSAVTCGVLVIAKTTTSKIYTATKTATTTLPTSTTTSTATTTTTEVSTSAAAPASTTTTTTTTVSTTTTETSTATNTATQTVTIVSAASTTYAACATNNVVNHANGNQGIYQIYYSGGGNTQPTTSEVVASDAAACCTQCQQLTGCTGFAQYPGQTRCFLFTNGQCDGSQNFGQFFKSSAGFAPTDGYTLGNGQCGRLENGGSG